MQLTDFYTQYAKGDMFKMLSLQQQIVVGESDTTIHIIYFMPTERNVATRFIDFIKKYSDFTKKPVRITTGGTEDNSDFGVCMDKDLFIHYHKKVTFWLVLKKEFDIIKSDSNFYKGRKVAENRYEDIDFRNIYNEKKYFEKKMYFSPSRKKILSNEESYKYFDVPLSFAKFTLEYKPK